MATFIALLFQFVSGLVLGGILGSFVGMLAYRLPRGKNIILPPSSCPHCQKRIEWRDLVPVYSFIKLKGKCRNCGKELDKKYLHIEVTNAGAVGLLLLVYGFSFKALTLVIIFEILLTLGLILSDQSGIRNPKKKTAEEAKKDTDDEADGGEIDVKDEE